MRSVFGASLLLRRISHGDQFDATALSVPHAARFLSAYSMMGGSQVKCFVLNDQSERREGLKALLRQIDRRAKFSEAKDWRQIHFTLKRDLPDLLVIDWQHHW